MEMCDEKTAKFMAESLLEHAQNIYRYAKTYSQPIYDDRQAESKLKSTFVKTVERMLKEMYALMLMAKYKGISRFCNREQIEAYMEEAEEIISAPSLSQAEPLLN